MCVGITANLYDLYRTVFRIETSQRCEIVVVTDLAARAVCVDLFWVLAVLSRGGGWVCVCGWMYSAVEVGVACAKRSLDIGIPVRDTMPICCGAVRRIAVVESGRLSYTTLIEYVDSSPIRRPV